MINIFQNNRSQNKFPYTGSHIIQSDVPAHGHRHFTDSYYIKMSKGGFPPLDYILKYHFPICFLAVQDVSQLFHGSDPFLISGRDDGGNGWGRHSGPSLRVKADKAQRVRKQQVGGQAVLGRQ